MKIAYLILAHGDPEMLEKLVTALNYHADFFIHIDSKSKMNVNLLKKMANVYFVKRVNVRWAGYSMINATLNLIEKALKENNKYKKIILISGQDYPLYSGKQIFDHLNNDINYIRGFNVMSSKVESITKEITNRYIYDIPFLGKNGIAFRIVRRIVNETCGLVCKKKDGKIRFNQNCSWNVYKGSQWWALNEDFLQYTMNFLHSSNGKKLKKEMKHYFSPDEKFFHTIFFNSGFKSANIAQGEEVFPRYIYMKKHQSTAVVAFFSNIHLIHPSLNKVFTLSDLHYVKQNMKNPNVLFIRKVNSKDSKLLIQYLDKNEVFKN
ncbi:beta-1,6-N-acetylglucosaminyltransferase [Pediococcus sp. M21F004]|uniref:beta-1,6-N-acetylglucosaminyltransferase n=1 Tax=Pediococcus sp. M21F004 TaxID=3390033 RepID=UPI003DA75339